MKPALKAIAIYDIAYKLADLAAPGRMAVMPQTKGPLLLARGGQQHNDVKIDVAIQYKFTAPTAQELDPYMRIAEQVPDLFMAKPLDSGAVCTEASFPHGLFLQRHIEEFRAFTSVVTLNFLYSL